MFELLCILVVMVYIVSKLDSRHFEQAKADWGLARAGEPGMPAAAPPRPEPRLAIEGTVRPAIADKKFVKGFGINPMAMKDLRIYAEGGSLDQFPQGVTRLLQELHETGGAVGPGVMEVLHHRRDLARGEAVYFALVDAGAEPRVVAFVDRLR